MDKAGPASRYKWRLTWPSERDDHFCGFDGLRRFGMIHKHHNCGWAWFMNWDFPFPNSSKMLSMCGYADTARLAAKEAEDCYDAVLAGTWPGMLQSDIERIKSGEIGHQEMMAIRANA